MAPASDRLEGGHLQEGVVLRAAAQQWGGTLGSSSHIDVRLEFQMGKGLRQLRELQKGRARARKALKAPNGFLGSFTRERIRERHLPLRGLLHTNLRLKLRSAHNQVRTCGGD